MTGGLLVVSVVQQLHLPGQSVLMDFGGVVVTRVGGSGFLGSAGAEVGTDPGFPTPEYCCPYGKCIPVVQVCIIIFAEHFLKTTFS